MVLLLPPAPAALVLLGRTLASLSFWSAAALLRMAVFGPPGGVGEIGLPELCPTAWEATGEEARGDDCMMIKLTIVPQARAFEAWRDSFGLLRKSIATARRLLRTTRCLIPLSIGSMYRCCKECGEELSGYFWR